MKKVIFILLSLFLGLSVSAFTGTIDSTDHWAKVCHDATCASPTPGTMNWKPSSGTSVVVDSVTGLSGQIWGNELGWIDLQPTGQGVTFENATTGTLIGKAWSQVSGWINFKPTGQQVTINPSTGEFSGYAWTGGPYGGWIKFDCSDSSTCVATSWRGYSSSSGGGGTGGYRDVCPNIADIQASIPNGYTISIDGMCVEVVDACPNIYGAQSSIPEGFTTNIIGACIPNIDFCPNINGIQATIPPSYVVTEKGNCVIPKKDVCKSLEGIQYSTSECSAKDLCTNIPGIQSITPKGYKLEDNFCYLLTVDLCKNIEGNQTRVPEGKTINENGNCIDNIIDVCSNLGGHQDHVPIGFVSKNGLCLFGDESIFENLDIPTVAYSFVPEKIQIPSENEMLKDIVGAIVGKSGEFKVDLVSVGISLVEIFILILLFIWITRRLMR